MQLATIGRTALFGLTIVLSGCTGPYAAPPIGFELARVDPEEASERALTGAVVGATLGSGLGAAFAIDPALGAVVGAESGAGIGAAIGAATAQPLPAYKPILVPRSAVIPGFYDTWPPGFHPPPIASQAPPSPPG